ncbi:GIDE domain-containing protein [Candidatus Thiodiazotropha sp. CDECU1]|uniref:GIDE domain-containing protein n=1 Tax=Candidatus Thiodiazotropha sp. CDECU1 TaxID=3065865 RepID=UPI00292D7332|nr:GIDE domain-containing protein [Candidatus Thiodiazotropha sp. CDECU1]
MIGSLANIGDGYFWSWTLLLTVLTLIALYFTFRNLHRARLIEDTPTSLIRSAPQGYVELVGEAAMMAGEPVLAPLSGMPCCWWRYKIEKKGDKGWRGVRSGKSDSLFLLKDATGECILDPEGANISPSEKSIWYGPNETPSAGPDRGTGTTHQKVERFGVRISTNNTFGGDYRYIEETIVPGDPLYAIGRFSSIGELDRKAMRDDMIKGRLRQWKADHATLLERFDRNDDGQIDLHEWESVRRSAAREVTREQMQQDQQPLHTLSSTGTHRRPLLISTKGEFELVRHYRLLTLAALAAFFVVGSGAVIFVTSHLSRL